MNRLLTVVVALTVLLTQSHAPAQSFLGTTPAVEFPEGLDWINTDQPLTLADLRGKIVVLDFWTYGCINCIHVIPDLQRLMAKYPDELVIIGVHSAKFDNEGQTENIRLIAERYERSEPIVNDNEFEIWRSYGINAWPSFIVIDPEGNVLGRHVGEGIYDLFDQVIGGMIEVFDARGTLDRSPLEFNAGAVVRPRAALRFPGGILADEDGGRVFIADTGNHRIVITSPSGTVLDVIGSGVAELRDGSYEDAGFQRPHGMTLAGPDLLYVADTGNHSIRLVDLAARTVTTVAGVGRQQYMFNLGQVSAATDGLNSPWDVLWHDGQLYIAMAGQHQLWRYDPAGAVVWLFAGSGHERLLDGPLRDAGLNQPSGLATDGLTLFVADSEASAIRAADFDPAGRLATLVGTGLFDFGDLDGFGDEVRLQHPKSVAYENGLVYIADTYNNRIKVLHPDTREVRTVYGSGEAGWADGLAEDVQFHEPGALSLAGDFLYVADTNNHLIRVAQLSAGAVTTLELSDPDGLLLRRGSSADRFDDVLTLDLVEVAPGDGLLVLELSLPEGYVANDLAPLTASWFSTGEAVAADGATGAQRVTQPEYPLDIVFAYRAEEGQATIVAEAAIYYCHEDTYALCLIRQVQFRQPVTVADGAADVIEISYSPPPRPAGF